MLLIHGRTGDENVMWIFTRNIPRTYWLISPRGPVSDSSGYSWIEHSAVLWPSLMDFSSPAASLMRFLDDWRKENNIQISTLDVMGFSQGAALAYALTAFYPQAVERVIALAGFLPQDDSLPGRYRAAAGKSIYIAHGSQDKTVPLTVAEDAVQTLTAYGAKVTYCESNTGHKLSANCLRGLEEFITSER